MIRISVSEETTRRVEKILAGVPKGAERALSNALNRGLSRIKTGSVKEVKEVYTAKHKDISSNSQIKIKQVNPGNLAGYVSFNGVKIPLYKFSVTPKSPGTGRKVHAVVKRDGGGTFEDAFIAQMPAYNHVGVFTRTGKERFPVEEKMGLSMAQMVGNDKVLEQLEQEAQKTVDQRIEHEITRLLNGYGG